MQSNTPDETIDHSSKLKRATSHSVVLELIDRVDFSLVIRLGYTSLDHHLITTLGDRWMPETSLFHLWVGEMTITLSDVAVMLGVPIDSVLLSNPELVDYMELCERLLGISPIEQWWGNEMMVTTCFREELANDIPQTPRTFRLSSVLEPLYCISSLQV